MIRAVLRWGIVATTMAALAIGVSCRRSSSRSGEVEATVVRRPPQETIRSSPGTGVRRAPPEDDGDPGMLPFVIRALEGYDGRIGFLGERADGDRRFGPLEARITSVDSGPFQGRTSVAALAALREAEARYLIVTTLDPEIAPWPSDHDTTLQVMLRDGVPTPRFHPVVIGRAHILYRVGDPAEIDDAQRRSITGYLRAQLGGPRAEGSLAAPPDEPFRGVDGQVRVVVALRPSVGSCRGGRAISRRTGSGRTIRAALDDVASQIRRDWRRARGRSDCTGDHPSVLAEGLSTVTIQVELVHRMATISDRAEDRLYYLVELGREGVWLRRGRNTWLLTPTQTIHRAVENAEAMVERLGRWNDQPANAWRDDGYEFGRFETLAWVELEPGDAGSIRELYRGVPLVRMADITRESVVDALVQGARFLARHQTERGEYRYLYRPLRTSQETRWAEGNNIVRHTLCPLVVIRAHHLQPDPELLASARRAIDYPLSFLRRDGDRCHVWYQDQDSPRHNAKMGTVAGLVMSIVELHAIGEDISDYRDELECLGNQIMAMLGEDGEFVHYDVPAGHPFHGRHNTIYPGELMLALARLHDFTGEARYREGFDRAMQFQRDWFHRLRSETTEDGIYDERHRVDLISFEPWGIMALDDMHRQHPDDDRYPEVAFELVDFVDGFFQFDLDRAQYADYLGSYFKTQQELPAINSCGYSEGAAAAYSIALRTGERVEERRQALLFGIRFVMQLQYHSDRSLFYMLDPEAAEGGFRYNLSYSRVRNDYMYHAMNALAVAAATFRPEDYPARVSFGDVPESVAPAFEGLPAPGGGE